jgi:hypothetical protein
MEQVVREAAEKALAGAKDYDEATARLISMVAGSPSLKAALTDPVIPELCRAAVTKVGRNERPSIWIPTQRNTTVTPSQFDVSPEEQAERLKRSVMRGLYAFRLPSGMLLGDARRKDVGEACDFYGKQASDMAWKGRWLSAIADRVGGKMVRNALSEEQLAQLQEETK